MKIRTMTPADLPFGLALSVQNGWNQLEADWRRQLDLEPAGCFMAEMDGRGVGTACACVFGSIAWIALVLVDASRRGQGIGTALMQHTLDWLDGRGVASVRLDATPLGQPIYEKLGFVTEYTLHRYAGILHAEGSASDDIETADDWTAVLALDRRVTGTDRSRLLDRLQQEQPNTWRVVRGPAEVEGFIAARPGARAWQIGPCLGSAAACRRLLADAGRRYAGRMVYVDVPAANTEAIEAVNALGLTVQRSLVRMGRGLTIREQRDEIWASFGPEKG